jgi:DNA-binding transcriptional MerR regulator
MLGFTSKDLARITKINLRTIQFWTGEGLIIPDIESYSKGKGRGRKNIYSFPNIIECSLIRELEMRGLRLQQIFLVLEQLRREREKQQKDYFTMNAILNTYSNKKSIFVIVTNMTDYPFTQDVLKLDNNIADVLHKIMQEQPSQILEEKIQETIYNSMSLTIPTRLVVSKRNSILLQDIVAFRSLIIIDVVTLFNELRIDWYKKIFPFTPSDYATFNEFIDFQNQWNSMTEEERLAKNRESIDSLTEDDWKDLLRMRHLKGGKVDWGISDPDRTQFLKKWWDTKPEKEKKEINKEVLSMLIDPKRKKQADKKK